MRKTLILITILLVFVFACGAPADITLKLDQKPARSMSIKSATFDIGDSFEGAGGNSAKPTTFLLTNFDPQGKDLDKYGPALTSTDQVKIHFNLVTEKTDANKDMKLRPGTFYGARFQTGLTDNDITINSFRVFTFADGSEQVFARMGSNKGSFVKITSVNDETISGEIAFTDGEESVIGKFTAKALKGKKSE